VRYEVIDRNGLKSFPRYCEQVHRDRQRHAGGLDLELDLELELESVLLVVSCARARRVERIIADTLCVV